MDVQNHPAFLSISGLADAAMQVEASGYNVVDIFSILLSNDGKTHVHSRIGLSREYVAAVIDILERVLRELNLPETGAIQIEEIDYRRLLIRYMAHVQECGGMLYFSGTHDIIFNDAEDQALKALESEVYKELGV